MWACLPMTSVGNVFFRSLSNYPMICKTTYPCNQPHHTALTIEALTGKVSASARSGGKPWAVGGTKGIMAYVSTCFNCSASIEAPTSDFWVASSASMSSPKNLVQSFAILISPWWFWFATDIVPTCTQDIRNWLINCKQWWNQYW